MVEGQIHDWFCFTVFVTADFSLLSMSLQLRRRVASHYFRSPGSAPAVYEACMHHFLGQLPNKMMQLKQYSLSIITACMRIQLLAQAGPKEVLRFAE